MKDTNNDCKYFFADSNKSNVKFVLNYLTTYEKLKVLNLCKNFYNCVTSEVDFIVINF